MSKTMNIKVIIYSILLGCLSMLLVIWCGMQKQTVMAASGQEQPILKEQAMMPDGDFSDVYKKENETKPLCIPLPADCQKEQLEYRNDYVQKRIQFCVEGLPKDYFYENKLTGKAEHIEDIVYSYEEGMTYLYIYLDSVYECQEDVEQGKVYLTFVKPQKLYEKRIVIDAGHGGKEKGSTYEEAVEKEITLDIALRLKEMLDASDIKVYYTRTSDKIVPAEKRTELANAVNADMFLSIHCAADENDAEKYGITTYYNDTYFIPEFGNADFAYEVEEKLAKNVSGKALGIEAGEEIFYLVKHSMVPTAFVEVGYLSNEEEKNLLNKAEYRERIAKGLYEAIVNSYELLSK